MSISRMRMLAGPNGSGKSTLFDYLQSRVNFGHLLNPDVLEKELAERGSIDFGRWNVIVDNDVLHNVFRQQFASLGAPLLLPIINENVVTVTEDIRQTYFTSVLCDYLRHQWLITGQTFTFETVMSHSSKVELLQEAIDRGYRAYLYFVCTEDPRINVERVESRVQSGGHGVPAGKITERYYRSLKLLPDAIRLSTRAYLFDNSGKQHELVAEFDHGKLVAATTQPPSWCIESALKPLAF